MNEYDDLYKISESSILVKMYNEGEPRQHYYTLDLEWLVRCGQRKTTLPRWRIGKVQIKIDDTKA